MNAAHWSIVNVVVQFVVCFVFVRILVSFSLVVEQGRIHGMTVADGWAGAEMQKTPTIQKSYGRTD